MTPTSFTLKNSLEVQVLPAKKTPRHALVLLHGRGASASNILGITQDLTIPDTCVVIAPQAPQHTWYPHRFTEPQTTNEPQLGHSLSILSDVCTYLHDEYELQPEQVTLGGFSQGACLVAEFLKRSPARYAAAAILSGGLIGTDQEAADDKFGSFDQLPVYLGCDEADPHIPKQRVLQSAKYFSDHGASVTLRVYTSLGHTIHSDGLRFIEENLG